MYMDASILHTYYVYEYRNIILRVPRIYRSVQLVHCSGCVCAHAYYIIEL